MKSIKFAQSQTNMNDWEYKAERQQEKRQTKTCVMLAKVVSCNGKSKLKRHIVRTCRKSLEFSTQQRYRK